VVFGLGKSAVESKVKRILIVEDEPLVAFDNEHFLHEAGFEVVATIDRADEAFRLIAAGGIDLVMADVKLSELGGGTGIDVARVAHEAGIPVIFVTGECPTEARGYAVGCLAKPYSQRELHAAIDAVAMHMAGEKPKRLPRGFTLFAE